MVDDLRCRSWAGKIELLGEEIGPGERVKDSANIWSAIEYPTLGSKPRRRTVTQEFYMTFQILSEYDSEGGTFATQYNGSKRISNKRNQRTSLVWQRDVYLATAGWYQ